MTQDDVEKRILLYTKKKSIYFDDDDIISKMSVYISNPKTIEYCQEDRLQQLFSLFNGISKGRGEPIQDERNGKAVCTKIKSEIKKYMAIHFNTLKKGFSNQYEVYEFVINDRLAQPYNK